MLLMACNDMPEATQETKAENFTNSPSDSLSADAVLKARIESGDTLMKSPEEMLLILPLKFEGFELTDTSSQILDFDRRRMSEAIAEFSGDEKDIKISLIDYNRNLQAWMGLYSMYRTDYILDNESEFSSAWKPGLGENFGWLSVIKEENFARITLGFSYRYLLTLEISGQKDTTGLKQILSGARWDQLN